MKMTKKKVFVAALAICLIAIISMGTLAWFNATDDITNNFKVATDENDTDPTFSVKVSETDLSKQVSRGSAGEYQSDERAGVAGLSWRVSG